MDSINFFDNYDKKQKPTARSESKSYKEQLISVLSSGLKGVTASPAQLAQLLSKSSNQTDNNNNLYGIESNGQEVPRKINPEDYTVEKIRAKYKDYEIDVIYNSDSKDTIIKIIGKNGKTEKEITIGDDKSVKIKEDYDEKSGTFNTVRIYDKNGNLKAYKQDGVWNDDLEQEDMPQITSSWSAKSTLRAGGSNAASIAQSLYDDIYAKNSWGVPTTGKHIKEHVSQINKNNVMEVMSKYYKKTSKPKQTLISAIFHEVGLSASDRAAMVRHIENCLLDAYAAKGIYVDDMRSAINKEINYQKSAFGLMDASLLIKINNKLSDRLEAKQWGKQKLKPADGTINQVSYQGHTGDCWLIASINSIARSPKGKKILDDSIKVNADGSVSVHLKGVNKTYTFSKKELRESRELATGDLDVRALEKAVEKYMMEECHDDIDGNRSITAYKILLGKSHLDLHGYDDMWDRTVGISDSYKKKINDPNTICTASVSQRNDDDSGNNVVYTTSDGVKIYANHAYSVVRADSKYVYLINPWDGGKEIRMSFKNFAKIFTRFTDVTI